MLDACNCYNTVSRPLEGTAIGGYGHWRVRLLEGMASYDIVEVAEKILTSSFFVVAKENWTMCLYLIISFKRLNEITLFFFLFEM